MKTVTFQLLGGRSPWTRPSAPECGDTLKGLSKLRLGLRWGSGQPGSGVAIDWVTGRSCSSGAKARRRLNVESGPAEDAKVMV